MRARGVAANVVLALFCIATAQIAAAQQCDDSNACTSNDMCADGMCTGTPQSSGSCNDFNDCTVNDTCQAGGLCLGTSAPNGTGCAGGCGTCQPVVPVPGAPTLCAPIPGMAGQPCDGQSGPCFEARCQVFATITTCIPSPTTCPDTDGNPCTDGCNFETGQCQVNAPKCFPPCESCNAGTGACEPANIGASCDDFNVCTAESRCEAFSAGGMTRGLCLEGASTGPTPTVTPGNGGPTPTATESPEPGECVANCNDDEEVTLGEVQVAFNIFLGNADPEDCTDADANEDGEVSLGEVQMGFNGFLNGCLG
jgi:hypothetical protein